MIGWRPGERGPLVSVQQMRRQMYEDAAASRRKAIAERMRTGTPLDDGTDWAKERARIVVFEGYVDSEDTALYRRALEQALMATNGALVELPPWEPDPRLEGIEAAFRSVSRREWQRSFGRVQETAARLRELPFDQIVARGELAADIDDACAVLVRGSLVQLQGLQVSGGWALCVRGDETVDDVSMGILEASGLIDVLYSCAREFQGLPPEGRKRFGLPPPSTSANSTAADAQSACVSSGDATVPRPPPSFPGQSTRPGPVLVVSPSGIPSPRMPSPFGAPPTEGKPASLPTS